MPLDHAGQTGGTLALAVGVARVGAAPHGVLLFLTGISDLAGVRGDAVATRARSIGAARRYYATAETVADIEQLRAALGADRLTIDGVSYGTYVAERYALESPRPRRRRAFIPSIGLPRSGTAWRGVA